MKNKYCICFVSSKIMLLASLFVFSIASSMHCEESMLSKIREKQIKAEKKVQTKTNIRKQYNAAHEKSVKDFFFVMTKIVTELEKNEKILFSPIVPGFWTCTSEYFEVKAKSANGKVVAQYCLINDSILVHPKGLERIDITAWGCPPHADGTVHADADICEEGKDLSNCCGGIRFYSWGVVLYENPDVVDVSKNNLIKKNYSHIRKNFLKLLENLPEDD
jgi:hypothetical protein